MGVEDKERKTRMDKGGITRRRRRQSRSVTHLVICMVAFEGFFIIFFFVLFFNNLSWIFVLASSLKKMTARMEIERS